MADTSADAGGGTAAGAPSLTGGATSKQKAKRGKITATIHDRTEEYAYMNPSDIREALSFNLIEFMFLQVGSFFFSGAFWLGASIIFSQKKFEFSSSLQMCALSIVFGVVLWIGGFIIFRVRQGKLNKNFPKI